MFCADTLSTVGVDVGIWKYRKDLEADQLRLKKKGNKPLRSVTFYTWDFGGQVSKSRSFSFSLLSHRGRWTISEVCSPAKH